MHDSFQQPGLESRGVGSPSAPAIEWNRILAPIDFSPASRRGLAFAADVAERFHSEIHLLYVIEPPVLPEWGYVHLALKEAKLRHEAEERLPQFPLSAGIDAALVRSTAVRSGDADIEICEAAIAQKADLIVIANHGLGGIKHALIGSTAEAVVRRASCPVLAVRDRVFTKDQTAPPFFAPRRILVTTDFSESSRKALPYAGTLARKFEASLLLAHVVPSHLPLEFSHLGVVLREERILAEAREQLPRFRQAELDASLQVETLVLHGSPAYEICLAAESQNADLIIISTHGHTGLKRFTLGSVTENVLRHAPCPVLVVRAHEHDSRSITTAQ